MCLSCEIHDKWPPFMEFVVWFLLQGLSVGNHFGVWYVLQTEIIDITNATYRNATVHNSTTTMMPSVTPINLTTTSLFTTTENTLNMNISNISNLVLDKTAEEQWDKLLDFRQVLLVFCIIGATLYVLHILVLIPNIVQSCRVSDPISLKDTGNLYFRSRLKVHALMLILETIIFDIPSGCLTMELVSLIWKGPLPESINMRASSLILALSLIGLAFIALYKGMMPLFLWIGNPFCFPCIPLRLLIVFPGGLIALVMTFGPVMGVAKNRLLQFAPEVIQGEIGGMASTFFSIGMIFWGIFLITILVGGCCWYKICREGADGNICSICC